MRGEAGAEGDCASGRLWLSVWRNRIRPGTSADLQALSEYHYRDCSGIGPGLLSRVLAVDDGSEVVGVLAVKRATLNATWREVVWPELFAVLPLGDRRADAEAVNAHLRTIGRLIVHPRHRHRGIATALVASYLEDAETVCTEALAEAAEGCKVFARAGMREVERPYRQADERLLEALEKLGVRKEWLADAGLWGPAASTREARKELRKELGIWLRVTKSEEKKEKRKRMTLEAMAVRAYEGLMLRPRLFVYTKARAEGAESAAGGVMSGGVSAGASGAGASRRKRGAGEEKGGVSAERLALGRVRSRRLARVVPGSAEELHAWLRHSLGVDVPTVAVGDGSSAPFAYLVHSFFEGRVVWEGDAGVVSGVAGGRGRASNDCVVWAARGTGKTYLGAVATVLDLVFKAGISVRILGGSLEQSQRMHEHLARLFERARVRLMLARPVSARSVELVNGSSASVLAASQTSVRGVRVQKLRCDEVDLFDEPLWSAAQLTTRSAAIAGPWGDRVRPTVEALSTMHVPGGLMGTLVERMRRGGGRVFRWNVLDVMEACGSEHVCERCDLKAGCAGRIKDRDAKIADGRAKSIGSVGFVSVSDVLAMRDRVDEQTWLNEMLCAAPSSRDAVFAKLSHERHVFADGTPPDRPAQAVGELGVAGGGRWVMGVDFGRRTSAAVLAHVDAAGVLRVIRERIAHEDLLGDQVKALCEWREMLRLDGVGKGAGGVVVQWVGADPAGAAVNEVTGRSPHTELRNAGFEVRAKRVRTLPGLSLVRARLERRGAGMTDEGVAADLLISSRCPETFNALRALRYKPEGSRGSGESVLVKDGPDHASDAVRYLVTALDRVVGGGVETY